MERLFDGKKFEIIECIVEDRTTITAVLLGSLTLQTAADFRAAFDGKLEGKETLIFDMSKLAYVTSAGIREMLIVIKAMSAQGGKVIGRHINDDVMKVLELMNINDLMVIEE